MPDIVIKAENIGKKYVIGHQSQRVGYTALRDVLMQTTRTLWNKTKDLATGKPIIQGDTIEEVWALKDVSFEVHRGEAMGIIGRNGAGKSTLLKLLSRITEPSSGRVTIKGRVASLLEVGTGFHPELSGRENIYLNGTILGMTRAEIKQKFDEIVSFAETEKYLDTPVKRYSSGMYVRLAFAVAANLDPEILLVDEVLAVGDAAFQKKCLGKMNDVSRGGRTVFFVSHNLAAIQGLCSRCLLLNEGTISVIGETQQVMEAYLSGNQNHPLPLLTKRKDRKGNGQIRFTSVVIMNAFGHATDSVICGEDVDLAISYQAAESRSISRVDFHITFYTLMGQFLFTCSSEGSGYPLNEAPPAGTMICHIPRLPLAPGRYSYNLYATVGGVVADWLQQAGILDVSEGDFFGTGQLKSHRDGFLVNNQWSMSRG